jgi:hypothetical protein
LAPKFWIGLVGMAGLVACSSAAPNAPQAAASLRASPSESAIQKVAFQAPAPARGGFTAAYRRLTESQYRNAVHDAFGPAIQINARFEPERREDGLQAIGNARMSITTSGLEQYYAAARSIADQVLDGKDRDAQIGCAPTAAEAASACAEQFIARRGAQLFRRPLTATETAQFKTIWQDSAKASGDFHKALKLTLVGMLMSPEFLFRVEKAEADPAQASGFRLDGYTKASRLSYLLWNTGPDAELLRAAQSGDLHTDAGLAKQVDRLLASPRLNDGVRAFFSDMLEFETFDSLSKDTVTYPKFSQAVADSAREETLKTLTDQLVTKKGDYRDIFTTRDTWIDRNLAFVYNVPFLSNDKWSRYTFPAESERSGVLTQVTFLSLFSHPGSSSPTVRGVKLNEIFLCVQIPQPPPDVDFSKVQALEHGTVRTRLLDHMTNPGCSGCHRISDPVGLTLERFDGLGQHRTKENNDVIDVSAEIGGRKFSSAPGLGQYLHDDPRTTNCVARKAGAYGEGRALDSGDSEMLARIQRSFATQGYKLPALFRTILTDPQFYRVVAPALPAANLKTASIDVRKTRIAGDGR